MLLLIEWLTTMILHLLALLLEPLLVLILRLSKCLDPCAKIHVKVDKEWGITLVIDDLAASTWIKDLVNGYMHGPIPMKVELCTVEQFRTPLSPLRILHSGSFCGELRGLRCFGRRTHEDEWDEARYYAKSIRFRQWAADYVQALIEGTYGRRLKPWGWIVDSLINFLEFDVRGIHLRIDDRGCGHSFGLIERRFMCHPGQQEPASLGATPHRFELEELSFYCDPHNDLQRSPQCTALRVKRGAFVVEFPDIFQTLILNREAMPGGRGKRLRCYGDFEDVKGTLQANQMKSFLFSCLGTFCPGKYSAWKRLIREKSARDCRPLSPSDRERYVRVFATRRAEAALGAAARAERAKELEALEQHMTYPEMVWLRRRARGWRLRPPDPTHPAEEELLEDLDAAGGDKEAAEAFARHVQWLKFRAWSRGTCLREVFVERCTARGFVMRLEGRARPAAPAGGAPLRAAEHAFLESHVFTAPLQATLVASEATGGVRLFIARTAKSYRAHSCSATGREGEPELPWLQAYGELVEPALLDEATGKRLGYTTCCLLDPAPVEPQAAAPEASRAASAAAWVPLGTRRLLRAASTASHAGEVAAPAGTAGSGTSSGTHGALDELLPPPGVPVLGGIFRMWSNYEMGIEGRLSNTRVTVLYAPIMDCVRTVVDSVRRRWRDGGMYPTDEARMPYLKMLEEEHAAAAVAAGPLPPASSEGSLPASSSQATLEDKIRGDDAGDASDASSHGGGSASSMPRRLSRRLGHRTSSINGSTFQGALQGLQEGAIVDSSLKAVQERGDLGYDLAGSCGSTVGGDAGAEADDRAFEPTLTHQGSSDSLGSASLDALQGGLRGGSASVASSLALLDTASEAATPSRRGSSDGHISDDYSDGGDSGAGSALGVSERRAVTTATDASKVAVGRKVGETASSTGARDAGAAAAGASSGDAAAAAGAPSAVQGNSEVVDEEGLPKVLLPAWKYLLLSGYRMSVDLGWDGLGLLLLQDPRIDPLACNALDLRSSGSLVVRSAAEHERIDLRMESIRLLPCAHRASPGGAAAAGSRDLALRQPHPSRLLLPALPAELLARTWIGQGLRAITARPLLQPATLSLLYGAEVLEAPAMSDAEADAARARVAAGWVKEEPTGDANDVSDSGSCAGGRMALGPADDEAERIAALAMVREAEQESRLQNSRQSTVLIDSVAAAKKAEEEAASAGTTDLSGLSRTTLGGIVEPPLLGVIKVYIDEMVLLPAPGPESLATPQSSSVEEGLQTIDVNIEGTLQTVAMRRLPPSGGTIATPRARTGSMERPPAAAAAALALKAERVLEFAVREEELLRATFTVRDADGAALAAAAAVYSPGQERLRLPLEGCGAGTASVAAARGAGGTELAARGTIGWLSVYWRWIPRLMCVTVHSAGGLELPDSLKSARENEARGFYMLLTAGTVAARTAVAAEQVRDGAVIWEEEHWLPVAGQGGAEGPNGVGWIDAPETKAAPPGLAFVLSLWCRQERADVLIGRATAHLPSFNGGSSCGEMSPGAVPQRLPLLAVDSTVVGELLANLRWADPPGLKETPDPAAQRKRAAAAETSAAAGLPTRPRAPRPQQNGGVAAKDAGQLRPEQAVIKAVQVRGSEWSLRLSELDIVVLARMSKTLVNSFRPPREKGLEHDISTVQEKLLSEARQRRLQGIEALRAAFRAEGAGNGGSGGGASDRLNLRDVVDVLWELERKKALTESEIRREVEDFMAIVTSTGRDSARRHHLHGSDWSGRQGLSDSDLEVSLVGASGGGQGHVSGEQEQPMEGFICPQCRRDMRSQEALVAHFAVFHDVDVAGTGSGASPSRGGEAAASESGDNQGSSGGGDAGDPDRSGGGPGSGAERTHGTVSLDKFIASLQTFMEEQPHEGFVLARCGEFASDVVVRKVLNGEAASLPELLAVQEADDPFPRFWGVLKRETGATPDSAGRQSAKTLQVRMVRAFRNYRFAREAWHYLVVPALYRLPRPAAIRAASGRRCCMMPAPVQLGQRYYMDKQAHVITVLPPQLARQSLTGVMTHRRDRSQTGVRAFLSFTLTRPAMVYVCYDTRLSAARKPVWLLYFDHTEWQVSTTECQFEVWAKRYNRGGVRLGCNEGWRKGCANYFVLLGPADDDDGGGVVADAGPGMSPRWLLREQSLAGGKVSLAQAVHALVEDQAERHRSHRLRQLVLGGSRARYDAAAAAAGDRGLELAPVRYEYTVSAELGGFRLAAADPVSPHTALAELRLWRVSAALSLSHVHPGDWLGRADHLSGRLRYQVSGTYLNSLVGVNAKEYAIEPWAATLVAESPLGAAAAAVRFRARSHFVANITSALLDSGRNLATLVATNWGDRYDEHLPSAAAPAGGRNSFVVRNRLGAEAWVYGVGEADDFANGGKSEGGSASATPTRGAGEGATPAAASPVVSSPPSLYRAQGFLCPRCKVDLRSVEALVRHDQVMHGGDDDGGDGGWSAWTFGRRGVVVPQGGDAICILPPAEAWGGSGAGAEWAPPLTVLVDGFEAVRGIQVAVAGTNVYPLVPIRGSAAVGSQASNSAVPGGGGVGGAVTAALVRREAGYMPPPRAPKNVRSVRPGAASGSGASSGGGGGGGNAAANFLALVVAVKAEEAGEAGQNGTVMELCSNVRLANRAVHPVEVDVGSAAAFRLDPGQELPLPLPVLLSRRLRLRGNATNAWDSPIQLTPALLDPSVPHALRRTQVMEANSLVLQLKDPKGVEFLTSSATEPPPSPVPGGPTPATTSPTAPLPPSVSPARPRSGSSARAGAGGSANGPSTSLPSSPSWISLQAAMPPPLAIEGSGGGASGSGVAYMPSPAATAGQGRGVEWIITIHPPYTVANVLPCELEVQLLQPSQAEEPALRTAAAAAAAAAKSKRDAAIDLFFLPDTVQAMEQAFGGGAAAVGGNSGDSAISGSGVESKRAMALRVAKAMAAADGLAAAPLPLLPEGEAASAIPVGEDVAAAESEESSYSCGGVGGGVSDGAENKAGGAADVGELPANGLVESSRKLSMREASSRNAAAAAALANGHMPAIPGGSSSSEADAPDLLCIWSGIIDSGTDAKIGHVAMDRPLYVRVRLPSAAGGGGRGGEWSDALSISAGAHAGRLAFTSQAPEELSWETGCRGWFGAAPQLRLARSWGRLSSRRLTFYADYWIVNKTGVALWYRAKAAAAPAAVAALSAMAPELPYAVNGVPDSISGPTTAQEMAHAAAAELLLADATYFSDEQNLRFFGGERAPVMLSCPARKLQVLPYAAAAEALAPRLYICDMCTTSEKARAYRCVAGPWPGQSLYADSDVRLTSLPSQLEAARSKGQCLQLLGPAAEAPDPDNEAFMTFWASRDSWLFVCLDKRTPTRKVPPWLSYTGLRLQPDEAVLAHSDSGGGVGGGSGGRSLAFSVWRRFVRARTLVRLGGNGNVMDFGERGPPLPNFLAFLCSCEEDGEASEDSRNGIGSAQLASKNGFSGGNCGGAGDDGRSVRHWSSRGQVDVQDVVVERDMTESIVCRDRYHFLPDFCAGDCPYVDRDYVINELPEALQGLRLVCVQTAQNDKRASGSGSARFVRFTLMQDAAVLLCFDGRARALPRWVADAGFERVPGLEIDGANYKQPYKYNVFRKDCRRGIVWLGGNRAPGAKRNYFVLIHVLDSGGSGSTGRGGGHANGSSAVVSGAAGLQTVAPLWDVETAGPLEQFPLPLDLHGRYWSRRFNVDAVSTTGQLQAPGVTLGVSISALPGIFGRTKVVTLYPRFIVRNDVEVPLEIWPATVPARSSVMAYLQSNLTTIKETLKTSVARRPKATAGGAPLAQRPAPPRLPQESVAEDEVSGAGAGGAGAAVEKELPTRFKVVYPLSSAILYDFPLASSLLAGMQGREAAAAAAASAASGHHMSRARRGAGGEGGGSGGTDTASTGDAQSRGHAALGGANRPGTAGPAVVSGGDLFGLSDPEATLKKCLMLRTTTQGWGKQYASDLSQGVAEGGEAGRPPSQWPFWEEVDAADEEAPLSQPVLAEELGETHLWVTAASGRKILVRASVTLQKATVFLTLNDAAQFPPYRVENRSSAETVVYRQEGLSGSGSGRAGWYVLPPLQWHSFLWEELDAPRELLVAFGRDWDSSRSQPHHFTAYQLDKIGELEPLVREAPLLGILGRGDSGGGDGGGGERRLFVEVRAEGRTRVISFGDVLYGESLRAGSGAADAAGQAKRLYSSLELDARLAGAAFALVQSTADGPVELLSGTADYLVVAKRGRGNRTELSCHHAQLDDMRQSARMPVLLQPVDSGFNSHLRSDGRIVPFLRVLYEREAATLSVPHFRSFEVAVQELALRLDVDFLLRLMAWCSAALPQLAGGAVLDRLYRTAARRAVRHTLAAPARHDSSLVYFEVFRHASVILHVQLHVSQRALALEALAVEDPEVAGGLALFGGGFLSALSVVGSSVAHVNPTFVFDELLVTHYFGNALELAQMVALTLAQQGVAQGYKVVASMELLGDPLSLVNKLGDSVAQFFRKTRAEFLGDSANKGEGARALVKGLVSGAFGSAAKIAGTLEGVVRGLSGTELEQALAPGSGQVRHLGHGLQQGGQVLYSSVKQGISGLVDRPLEGAKEEGVAGFITGVAKGLVGAVAAPVAGALGAVSRVTEGVDASTRYYDEKRMPRRRAARGPTYGSAGSRALLPLSREALARNVPKRSAPRGLLLLQDRKAAAAAAAAAWQAAAEAGIANIAGAAAVAETGIAEAGAAVDNLTQVVATVGEAAANMPGYFTVEGSAGGSGGDLMYADS